jgi:glycosyltransferase involved in cell wall biosynthesis
MKYKFYSIIIPSYNRVDEILELLESIKSLDFPKENFEVIVIDDGSTDATMLFLQEFNENAPYNFSYYSQANQGPGAARNLGMQHSKGDFLIFVDSDVTVPNQWLAEIEKKINEQQADAFGGPDSYRKDFSALLKAINYSMTSFITTGGLRGKKGKKLAKFYPRSFNMGLSKTLWKAIGGFGNLRHGQDIEFSNRIIRNGAKVAFVEKAHVYHKRRTNFRRFFRQVFNWGIARVNLYKIDNAMLEPLHAAPAVATLIIFLTIVLAIFFKPMFYVLIAGVFLSLIILLYSMIDAIKMYKEIKPALLLPFVMPAQIIGYGLGFIYNFIRRVIFGKKEKVGFKRSYYK